MRNGLGMAKHRFDIAHGRPPPNERADAARIEFIQLRVRDIGRRGVQPAGLIEPKRQHIRAVAMTKRIARVNVRRVIHAELMRQTGTVADNVVTGAWPERNVM